VYAKGYSLGTPSNGAISFPVVSVKLHILFSLVCTEKKGLCVATKPTGLIRVIIGEAVSIVAEACDDHALGLPARSIALTLIKY